ncbi:hypothetical protein ACVIKP_004873, partial [Rhizobium leguminosarum]
QVDSAGVLLMDIIHRTRFRSGFSKIPLPTGQKSIGKSLSATER